jgi:PAS domain S-box-containing protein
MTVATKLRLASGVVIAALVAILAVALYVPTRLNASANEKYGNEAIPFRQEVHDLVLRKLEQKAAADRYVVTRDEASFQRYLTAEIDASSELSDLTGFFDGLPALSELTRSATTQSTDVDVALRRQIEAADIGGTRDAIAARIEVDRAFARFRSTTDKMLSQAKRFTDEAESEQHQTYRQLLFSLSALGTLGIALALALFLLVPRRVGQLYESEQRNRREAESRAEAARALEHVSDGVILTDAEGVIEFWNPGATSATGIAEHAAIGRPLQRLLPNWARLARQHGGVHGGGAAVVPIQLESERWLSVTSVDFGEGVVYAIRDVTEERALETMRSDFVATASHELRTPLTSISGAARTLVRHSASLTPDRREAFLQMIVTESDRLAGIVDQILLASRIEAGQIEVTSEPVDALDVTRSVVDAVALRAPQKIRLTLDGGNGLQPVDCDPDRLRQVLGNLLDNAIKYSPEGGEVRVTVEPNGSTMRFAVHDEGIGFEPAAADAIFERFRRLDPNLTRGIGGTGLGLYICKELVERMAGRIWAESRPGEGATFYFELPLAREAVGAG